MKKKAEQEDHLGRPGVRSDARVDARQSPFCEWLDNAAIRDLVRCSLGLSSRERRAHQGTCAGLVEAMGLVDFDGFLEEVAIKVRRFEEAVEHRGEGRAFRMTPGEEIGGPPPAGHDHIALARDPDQVAVKPWFRSDRHVPCRAVPH